MRIMLTRLTERTHRMEIVRHDGSRESVELETRSFFLHDLIHFAVESEAGARNDFYGKLSRGASPSRLIEDARAMGTSMQGDDSELGVIESIVGPPTSVVEGRRALDAFLLGLQEFFALNGKAQPTWLDRAFVERVLERLRRIRGEWMKLRFHESLTLDFDE